MEVGAVQLRFLPVLGEEHEYTAAARQRWLYDAGHGEFADVSPRFDGSRLGRSDAGTGQDLEAMALMSKALRELRVVLAEPYSSAREQLVVLADEDRRLVPSGDDAINLLADAKVQ